MDNVIKKLKEYKTEIDLKNRFNYDFIVSTNIFNSHEIDELSKATNPYEKNKKLKWLLSDKYKRESETEEIDFWIINKWGGINGFKPNERNIRKIRSFKTQLINKRLTKDSFSTISSLSKLSSFIDPDNFVIYDSRVIYTLNWLILVCENQNGFNQKYFPIPKGRNKKISDFDLETIINISHISEYINKTELYISQQDAYFKFCNFVKSNVSEIFSHKSKPFELEMLLFTLADKEIVEELRRKLKLTIDNEK